MCTAASRSTKILDLGQLSISISWIYSLISVAYKNDSSLFLQSYVSGQQQAAALRGRNISIRDAHLLKQSQQNFTKTAAAHVAVGKQKRWI